MATTSPPAIARGDSLSKDQLNKRMRRSEGQVRGIRGRVEDDRYCTGQKDKTDEPMAAVGRLMRRG